MVADEPVPIWSGYGGASAPVADGQSASIGHVQSGYANVGLKTGFSLAGFVTDDATHVTLKTDYATLRLPKSNILSIDALAGPPTTATEVANDDALPQAIPSSSNDDPALRAWSETVPLSVRTAFLKKVQPILLSRCGATDCHGSGATNDFRLASPRQHTNAAIVNLKASLRQLDLIDPLESRLITKPSTTHGKIAPLFSRSQQTQLNAIVQWADTAVAEVPKDIFDQLVVEALTKPAVQPPARASSAATEHARDTLKPKRFEANDPFDPGIFNMMYHTATSTSPIRR
ncbi:MAG: hypothetical protein ACRC46_08120 [Thermoguttaceae bacterium]